MVRSGAREIRVTTNEEVFKNHASFFEDGGFKVIDWQVNRYQPGTSELLWKLRVDQGPWQLGEHASYFGHGRTESEGTSLSSTQAGSSEFHQRWADLGVLASAGSRRLSSEWTKCEVQLNRRYLWQKLLDNSPPPQENTNKPFYDHKANNIQFNRHSTALTGMLANGWRFKDSFGKLSIPEDQPALGNVQERFPVLGGELEYNLVALKNVSTRALLCKKVVAHMGCCVLLLASPLPTILSTRR